MIKFDKKTHKYVCEKTGKELISTTTLDAGMPIREIMSIVEI